MKKEIARMEQQCTVEMEKRFGEGVTFRDIDSFAVNRTLEEMRESARRKEEARYKQLERKTVKKWPEIVRPACLQLLVYRCSMH